MVGGERLTSLSSFHGGHSPLADGREVPEIAEAVRSRNFLAFGFTEHFQTPPMAVSPDMPLHDQFGVFDNYVADVQIVQQNHPFILLGAEVEYIRGALAWTREQVSRWPLDYLVGSVHYVRLDGADLLIDWERQRIEDALELADGPRAPSAQVLRTGA